MDEHINCLAITQAAAKIFHDFLSSENNIKYFT